MGLGEVLVYYKLHKFPPETVKKVKVLHKIQFPGRSCINLVEAIKLMNEVTAEEVELTKDLVAVEQTLQGLTMTAVPKVSQATIPAVAPNTQSPAVAPNTQPDSTPKKKNHRYKNKWTTNKIYCYLCEKNGHHSDMCYTFKTPEQKRKRLAHNNRCQECAFKIETGESHSCVIDNPCYSCQSNKHKSWLCPAPKK